MLNSIEQVRLLGKDFVDSVGIIAFENLGGYI